MQPEKAERYKKEYGLSDYDAGVLTQSKVIADVFEETAVLCGKDKKAANWMIGETFRLVRERGISPDEIHFSPKHLAYIIDAVDKGEINQQSAKEVFEKVFDEDLEPKAYIEAKGLKIVQDSGLL